MAITYTIDSKREVVVARARGTITDGEVIATARKIMSDAGIRPDFRFLADGGEVERVAVTTAGIREIAKLVILSGRYRRVILLRKCPADFGLARMYQAYCDLAGSHAPLIFRDRKEALGCLNEGMPPEKVIQ